MIEVPDLLTRREVLAVRGSDIAALPSVVVVVAVPGSDRLVVCRAMWEEDLAARARTAGDGYLFLPQRQGAEPKNGISNWTKRTLKNGSALPDLKTCPAAQHLDRGAVAPARPGGRDR